MKEISNKFHQGAQTIFFGDFGKHGIKTQLFQSVFIFAIRSNRRQKQFRQNFLKFQTDNKYRDRPL